MRIREHGLTDRENSRMYTKRPRCLGHSGKFITASLIDTTPALMILLFGYLIAFTVLLTEFSIKRIRKKEIQSIESATI